MEKPQAIFLDAVGTLFGVRGSVGQIYGQIARDFGVKVPSEESEQEWQAFCQTLDDAFFQSFKASPPLTFPNVDRLEIPVKEYQWWQAVTHSTFETTDLLGQFSNFEAFFNRLYGHFATAQPWCLYEEILPVLQQWKSEKIELGIVSNFDSRIYAVLKSLELDKYFTSITISSSAGAAKPDGQIFAIALAKHNCQPQHAWYIGDSFEEDYRGASAAGLKAFWLERPSDP